MRDLNERENLIRFAKNLTMAEKTFLRVLHDYSGCGLIYPSMPSIALQMGTCKRTAQYALEKLTKKGLVTLTRRYDAERKVFTTNLFEINYDALFQGSASYSLRAKSAPGGVVQNLHQGGAKSAPGVVQNLHMNSNSSNSKKNTKENPLTPLPLTSNRNAKKKNPPVATPLCPPLSPPSRRHTRRHTAPLAAAPPPKGVGVGEAKVILELEAIQVPEHLQTPEFLEAWQERIEWAAARPKSSRPVLSSQIKELTPYSATEATMLVRRAMSWQGLGLDSYQRRKESNIPGVTTNSNFEDVIAKHRLQDSIRVARYENIYGREARERGEDGRAPKGWLAENLEAKTYG
jgi:hypothetical protein